MGFSTVFKNFGHAIATAAKYTGKGVAELLKIANGAQKVEPAIELLVGALAGPVAARYSDLAFHLLGDVANAVERLGPDFDLVGTSNGLNVTLDVQTLNDIRAAIPQLKAIIQALGGNIPLTTPAPKP